MLAVDVGGTHVKVLLKGAAERRRVSSDSTLTPERMIATVLTLTADWKYDVISLGLPTVVSMGRVVKDPVHLGPGWAGFDFGAAFGRPTRVVNDAAMQALGSYRGVRMLFLGLGTGLGTALALNGTVYPMEAAKLPFKNGKNFEQLVGTAGMIRYGRKRWLANVFETVSIFSAAFQVDEVVLGGGNAKKLATLPPSCRVGSNMDAFEGGFRLWDDDAPARIADGTMQVLDA